MAELNQVVADLQATKASLTQVNVDIADTQTQITALKAKVKELEDAIASGAVPQVIADLAAEVKVLAQSTDDALPNPIVVTPTP